MNHNFLTNIERTIKKNSDVGKLLNEICKIIEKAFPAEFNSIAIFPLIQNLKTIGAVYLYSDKKDFFNHDDLMLLEILQKSHVSVTVKQVDCADYTRFEHYTRGQRTFTLFTKLLK